MDYATDYKVRLFEDLQTLRTSHVEVYLKYSELIELEVYRLERAEHLTGVARQCLLKLSDSRFKKLYNSLRQELSNIQDQI